MIMNVPTHEEINEIDTEVKQINQNLSELNEKVENLSFEWDNANAVNIISYNSNTNRYTVPKNGIVRLDGTNYFGINGDIADMTNVSLMSAYSPGGNYRQLIFQVYKGQQIYCANCGTAIFVPYK